MARQLDFVVGAAAVTFIYHDEIKIIFGIFAKVRCIIWSAHKRLEDGEEDTAVGGNPSRFANLIRFDFNQRIFWKGRVTREFAKSLVGKNVSICKKQDARSA